MAASKRGDSLRPLCKAAPPIVDDLTNLESCLRAVLSRLPFEPPLSLATPDELPWVLKEILRIPEEFRTLALPILALGRRGARAAVPLYFGEAKSILNKRQE